MNMKTRKRTILIVAIAIAALLGTTAAVQARAIVTQYTGTEACEPLAIGQWTFHDGNIFVRGMELLCTEDATDPRMSGSNAVTLNANWHADPSAMMGGTGPMWGTWQQEGWAGTWEGTMLAGGGVYHAQGNGTGIYDGLKVWLDSDHEAISGRILDPHGSE
jgi:hypothetical protein